MKAVVLFGVAPIDGTCIYVAMMLRENSLLWQTMPTERIECKIQTKI